MKIAEAGYEILDWLATYKAGYRQGNMDIMWKQLGEARLSDMFCPT